MPRWLPILPSLLAAAAIALTIAPDTQRDSQTIPVLRDPAGRLRIGCGFDPAVSAPEVCDRDGQVLGVYLDDETPNLPYWVTLATARYPSGLVIVARSMGQHGCPFHGVLCAQEWYPYCSGAAAWAWGPIPNARAYIAQWNYGGLAGCHQPPGNHQRQTLLQLIRRRHPHLVLLY